MKQSFLTLTFFALGLITTAHALEPRRTVTGNVVSSTVDPMGRIEVLPEAKYVGAVRFTLYGAADCEIHLFVDADSSNRVRRLYWVQFEAYLAEQPSLRYAHHPAYAPIDKDGLVFYQRARFGQSSQPPQSGSDAEKGFELLKEKGYTLPAETVNVTYRHFLDPAMRKEILLMVLEDMATTGTSFEKLVQGGVVQPSWPPIAEQLLARASSVFSVKLLLNSAK
jgi:hypothetical protein